ncbi:Pentatricopeptide repeat-containing protein [Platanthera guangdongensis]|uniref:Pentatricopeptide repeat-containing protein n=1 Tax=Platanthera guangdongensis TaxID=2320717 RepID=A0ABR2MK38_9ASPA
MVSALRWGKIVCYSSPSMARHLSRSLSISAPQAFQFPGRVETFVLTSRIRDLAKLGSMSEARQLFDQMPHRDTFTWNLMINSYSENGMIDEARSLFDSFTGRNVRTWTALISGYSKQGRIEDARRLFDAMPERNIVSWNAIISGYVQSENIDEARQLFDRMPLRDVASWNSVITGYCRSYRMEEAQKLFDLMPERDLISWTVMISGYVRIKNHGGALRVFHHMRNAGVTPDQSNLVVLLSAVVALDDIELLDNVRSVAIKTNLEGDVVVGTSILNAYARDGENMDTAVKFFHQMPEKNDYSWSTIISSLCRVGKLEEAFSFYEKNPEKLVAARTSLLAGFARHGRIDDAAFIFDQIPNPNVVTCNAMITGYAQNGMIDEAADLFNRMPVKNSITWAAVVAGLAQNGKDEEALQLLSKQHRIGPLPTISSFTSGVSACANIADIERGRQLHSLAIKCGCRFNTHINNGLITMYAKCRKMEEVNQVFKLMQSKDTVSWNSLIGAMIQNYMLEDARIVFERMPFHDVVSWTAMISACVQAGHENEALKLFVRMLEEGVSPESQTLASLLTACGSLCAAILGQQAHGFAVKLCLDIELFVANSLISMYFKSGVTEPFRLFGEMKERDTVTFNSMLVGCAQHGLGREAIEIFDRMEAEGLSPNHASFVPLLSASSHAGLVDEGRRYFDSMSRVYGLEPLNGHYSCMVDLLGRAGRLNEAEELIRSMPIQPDSVVWRALLGACRIHKNVEIGRRTAEKLIHLDPTDCGNYILLSNLYSSTGMWDEAHEIRRCMRERGVSKQPGCSWIQIKNKMHCFITGDRNHDQMKDIYEGLKDLHDRIRGAGYVPDTSFDLHDVEEEQKESSLLYHSEKLAVVYALLRTTKEAPIRIMKNMRICGDCHSFVKIVSKISGREIDIRDGNRFHHVVDGVCTCGDYW